MHPYDVITLENGGKFIFTPCPGTKEVDLTSSIKTLKTAGADIIISMLPNDEITKLKVTELGSETEQQGMIWYQLPVEDDHAPQKAFFEAFDSVKEEILSHLANQKTIVIHCRGGSGRTGLMAAILLLESGCQWAKVKTLVQAARPKALTIPAHVAFLEKTYSL